MSVQDRINQIRLNSDNWRDRIRSCTASETEATQTLPSVSEIRQSLAYSQEGWRTRVGRKDAADFTVAGRIERPPSGASPHRKSLDDLEDALNNPRRPPAVPIVRATSKENRPAPKRLVTETGNDTKSSSNDLIKQTVTVPSMQEEALTSFFNTRPQFDDPVLSSLSADVNDVKPVERPQSSYSRFAEARRAARPERRKPKTSNPLRSTTQRADFRMEYQECRPSSVICSHRTSTPYQRLMGTVDPSIQISHDNAVRKSMLAESVIAGLSSTENFSDFKNILRPVTDDLASSISGIPNQLLPFKRTMLLHVKGRRRIQVRLVCPSADSLNSGDCFVLVTSNAVFAWLGSFANVVELNKARELAAWIYKHQELGFRNPDAEVNDYFTVQEQIVQHKSKDDIESGYAGQLNEIRRSADDASIKFWQALGYDEPQKVHGPGDLVEDELYEVLVQHTNRLYEVTEEQLIPCTTFWGCPIKRSLLRSDKAFVFDFGSEVYLWTGTQINPEVRMAGIELVNQAYAGGYDYTKCSLNPLDPLFTHANVPVANTSRPIWTLLGRVTERGETVLFREKFIDWPDPSRMGIRLEMKSKTKHSDRRASIYSAIQPYPADQLYEAAFNEPPPPPILLTLEGRFVGRGGEGCRYEDGIMRRYRVQSGPVKVWHVSEFSRSELTEIHHGQFHVEDTYVIRWPFKVIHVGMRDIPSKVSDRTKEQCAYFFWQGSQSKLTEQGAAALMTIELDEERGPQLRVTEGNEPPAFCGLFNGRMAIHMGRRSSPYSQSRRVRLFLVRGEVPSEGYLLEVPAKLSSLRPQGVFLVVQYSTQVDQNRVIQKAWLWCGRLAPEASLHTARHVVGRFKENCPPELASEFRILFEIQHTEDKLGPGEMVFLLNAEDHLSTPVCMDTSRGREPLVIWHLTLPIDQEMTVRRLTYSLQPDFSLLSQSADSKFPSDLKWSPNPNPLDLAKAVAERLRASNDAAADAYQKNVDQYIGFPFLLRELYEAPQPALFIVLSGKHCIYLWQGWWPFESNSRSKRFSHLVRQSSLSSTRSQTLGEAKQYDCEELVDVGCGDGLDDTDESQEYRVAGSARSRFYALRQAALKTIQALASKVGCRAAVVYAGLEPSEFLCLFPPYMRTSDAYHYNTSEEGKRDGQMDSVDSLLLPFKSTFYTLFELQQRPLPADLDATCLETYLSPEEFQHAFSMSKNEFDQLAPWKMHEMKKQLGLY